MTKLHYIYDPLCGWCYAAAPLVAAARAIVPVEGHAGGMMAGPNRQHVSEHLRSHIVASDRRIAAMTGQEFGQDYFDKLLGDPATLFDSEPPITAILAAEAIGGHGFDMLARLQRAHYVEGRRIAERAVLDAAAADLGLTPAAFATAFDQAAGRVTEEHIAHSRALLSRVGGRGFPTFVLETGGGLHLVDIGGFLGHVDAWSEQLRKVAEP